MTVARPLRRRPWSNQRGVSMIETVVALGLFGLSAAAIGDFLTHQVRASSSNHLYTVAYGLAADALESARAVNYDDIAPNSTTHQEGAIAFEVSTTVETDTPEDHLKTITATVVWSEPHGVHSVVVPAVYTEVRRF